MDISKEDAYEFANLIIQRGLGIYGRTKMEEICQQSGIVLLPDNTVDLKDDYAQAIERLMINYSKFNIAAKMTAVVFAKRFNIPVPKELKTQKKRKSRWRRLFSRG